MAPYSGQQSGFLERVVVALTLFLLNFGAVTLTLLAAQRTLPQSADWNPLVWLGFVTALTVVVYPPVQRFYNWLFQKAIFPERSRVPQFLNQLAREIRATPEAMELGNLLVNTLGEACHFKTVSLLVSEPTGERYGILSAYGWSVSDYRKVRLEPGNPLLELMKAARPEVLLREKVVRNLSWQESNQLVVHFEALRASCVIPLWVKDQLIGSVNLLAPPSDQTLDEEDLQMLKAFGEEVAPSLWKGLTIQGLRRVNETLQDRHSELVQKAKVRAIEQLATGIAHEIHNPLTIISGKAQVLLLQKDRTALDPKVEEVLKTVVQQTRRAADMTKKLLMFSRGSASPFEKLRLETVLEDTLALIAYQTSLEGIQIERLVSPELPDFPGNTQEIREVFLNLILNALQAAGPGGRIQVEITFQKVDKIIALRVADNGAGIPPENLEKVFNPFFTTRPEAVGLGLFVTQQIVHRYGGSIRVESAPGEGTVVVVELPWEAAPGEGAPDGGNFEKTEEGLKGETKYDTAPRGG